MKEIQDRLHLLGLKTFVRSDGSMLVTTETLIQRQINVYEDGRVFILMATNQRPRAVRSTVGELSPLKVATEIVKFLMEQV